MSLAQRLNLLIKSKNMSQAEFARKLEVTRGGVNQWLAGKLVPGYKPLMKIFEVFPDISADWLLLGRGEMELLKNPNKDNDFLRNQLKEMKEMIELYKKLIEEKDARIKLMEKLLPKQNEKLK